MAEHIDRMVDIRTLRHGFNDRPAHTPVHVVIDGTRADEPFKITVRGPHTERSINVEVSDEAWAAEQRERAEAEAAEQDTREPVAFLYRPKYIEAHHSTREYMQMDHFAAIHGMNMQIRHTRGGSIYGFLGDFVSTKEPDEVEALLSTIRPCFAHNLMWLPLYV